VILIKDTALVLVLGLFQNQLDIFSYAQEGYSSSANATFFVGAAIAYLAVTLPLIRLVNAAERKLRGGLLGINIAQQGL
jgi:polar amino acid transport system permease protein